jgi:hypothetical protein
MPTKEQPTPVPPFPELHDALRAIVSVPKAKVDAARRKETKRKQQSRRKGK